MKEVERLKSIFEYIQAIEVRGENIGKMYNLMGFLQQEMKKIEEKEKALPEQKE